MLIDIPILPEEIIRRKMEENLEDTVEENVEDNVEDNVEESVEGVYFEQKKEENTEEKNGGENNVGENNGGENNGGENNGGENNGGANNGGANNGGANNGGANNGGENVKRFELSNLIFDIKHNFISCGFVPTLEAISQIKLSIQFWHQEVPNLIDYLNVMNQEFEDLPNGLNMFENMILKQISYLKIPICWIEDLQKWVKLTGIEITKFFFSQDRSCFSSWDSLNIYWNNICWTLEGKVNYLKTALQLIDNPNLSDRDKFIIACNNCIEDKIRLLINSAVGFTHNYLILYWTHSIKGERNFFTENVNASLRYEYLLKWSISHGQEVAVQYILENFANEEMRTKLPSFLEYAIEEHFMKPYKCVTLLLYLFKQDTSFKIKPTNVEVSCSLIWLFSHMSRLYNVPKIKCIFELIEIKNSIDFLHVIIKCWEYKIIDFHQYQEYFSDLSNRIKSGIDFDFVTKLIQDSLIKYKDMITTILLLRLCSSERKKAFIFSETGMFICVQLRCLGRLKHLSLFVESIFDSEIEILYFMDYFLQLYNIEPELEPDF